MKRGIAAALAATLVVSLSAVGSATATETPSPKRVCDISGKQRRLGASYVTSLKVFGVSCRKGKVVTKEYHQCRKAHGGAGSKASCTIRNFHCKTTVLQEVKGVQFNGKMVCKKGDIKRIVSRYTQNY